MHFAIMCMCIAFFATGFVHAHAFSIGAHEYGRLLWTKMPRWDRRLFLVSDRVFWIAYRSSWIDDPGSMIVDRSSWIDDRGSMIVDGSSWIDDRGSVIVDQ